MYYYFKSSYRLTFINNLIEYYVFHDYNSDIYIYNDFNKRT